MCYSSPCVTFVQWILVKWFCGYVSSRFSHHVPSPALASAQQDGSVETTKLKCKQKGKYSKWTKGVKNRQYMNCAMVDTKLIRRLEHWRGHNNSDCGNTYCLPLGDSQLFLDSKRLFSQRVGQIMSVRDKSQTKYRRHFNVFLFFLFFLCFISISLFFLFGSFFHIVLPCYMLYVPMSYYHHSNKLIMSIY